MRTRLQQKELFSLTVFTTPCDAAFRRRFLFYIIDNFETVTPLSVWQFDKLEIPCTSAWCEICQPYHWRDDSGAGAQGSVNITSPINSTDISAKWKSFKIAHTSAFFHTPPKCAIHPPLKVTHCRISSQNALSRRLWGKKPVFWWDIGTPSLLGGSSQGL